MISSLPLHTQLQSAPVPALGQGPKMPAEPHHPQKAEMQFRVSQLDTLLTTAVPCDPVHHCHEQDCGQPWLSPTPTGNVFNFVLNLQTQLSLWLY